jgi:hypothetical protein
MKITLRSFLRSLLPGVGAVAVFPLAVAGCMSLNPPCQPIGCVAEYEREAPLSLTEAQIKASSVELCLNNVCQGGDFAKWEAPTTIGTGSGVSFPEPAVRESTRSPLVHAMFEKETNGFSFHVDARAWSKASLKNGDVWKIRLFDTASLQEHFTLEETVSYTSNVTSGAQCPAGCLSAVAVSTN